MKYIAAVLFAALFALAFPPQSASAQSACEVYRVKRGDTLRKIARSAYGYESYRKVYRANRSEIGRNPNLIRVGMVLRLPCLDGEMPGKAAQETSMQDGATFSFITANGYLPYTDESLGHRGLFTHLVENAMLRAAPDKTVEVVFVNDWSAHLEELLPRQAFDASFPWTRPACETQDDLTPIEFYACQNYIYSDPFYEIVEGFFSTAGSGYDSVIDFSGLMGTAICRPEGYPTGHLEENGLMPPAVTLVQPASAYLCFELLKMGRVDLVSLDTRAGERVLQDMGLTFQVSENPHLFSLQPLQVAVHKSNPQSGELIADLNNGLQVMLQSGEWASIVSEGLQEQAAALMN